MQDHHHQHHQSLTAAAAAFPQLNAQFPEHEQLRCPRCDSANTKFCYYNNYNLSQPRHFCKSCRRYWTKGGTLRNIPVGGGCRKNSKRPAPASNSSKQQRTVQNSSALIPSSLGSGFEAIQKQSQTPSLKPEPTPAPETTRVGTGSGLPAESFTSLLGLTTPNVQFDNLLQGFTRHGPGSGPGQSLSDGFMISGIQNGGNSHGWPDLAINTPGSKLQ